MALPLDLDAYLTRIGYGGPRTPSYATLAGLLRAHMASIPFEGFDVLLGRPVHLDLEGLQAKMITARRGGYCFEHASLVHAALTAMGFAPVRHASRVLIFEPRDVSGRQHMILTVAVEGATYVVDPGFGPFASPLPIPLDGTPVPAEGPTHRLAREGRDLVLRVPHQGVEVAGWASSLEEENAVDIEMMNHYIATHPGSFFAHNLVASAVTPEGRVNIMNQDVHILRDGATEALQLEDRAALRALVGAAFRLRSPGARDDAREWRAGLAVKAWRRFRNGWRARARGLSLGAETNNGRTPCCRADWRYRRFSPHPTCAMPPPRAAPRARPAISPTAPSA
jgi:N-hydroxyarylamine O-acetyltransferase